MLGTFGKDPAWRWTSDFPKEAWIEYYGSKTTSRFLSQTHTRLQNQGTFRSMKYNADYFHEVLEVRYASWRIKSVSYMCKFICTKNGNYSSQNKDGNMATYFLLPDYLKISHPRLSIIHLPSLFSLSIPSIPLKYILLRTRNILLCTFLLNIILLQTSAFGSLSEIDDKLHHKNFLNGCDRDVLNIECFSWF